MSTIKTNKIENLTTTDGGISINNSGNVTIDGLQMPTADGTAGQVLSTNGSGVLSFVNAITEVDQWSLQSDVSSNGVITDLARNPEPTATYIGTGMSVSSGVFTFPSTGKWLVFVTAVFEIDESDTVTLTIKVTTNNSTYDSASVATDGNNGTGTPRNGSGTAFHFMDVTDTSQTKVRFDLSSVGPGSSIRGSTTVNETTMLFVRLGDT